MHCGDLNSIKLFLTIQPSNLFECNKRSHESKIIKNKLARAKFRVVPHFFHENQNSLKKLGFPDGLCGKIRRIKVFPHPFFCKNFSLCSFFYLNPYSMECVVEQSPKSDMCKKFKSLPDEWFHQAKAFSPKSICCNSSYSCISHFLSKIPALLK